MIELIPAIDIIDGKCVRLTKGDYAQKKVYGDSPKDMARRFEDLGVKRLHVVDLDGAKSKHIVNSKALEQIAEATNLIIDFGGGIKTDEDIHTAFDCGAAMVTIGSVAISAPHLFEEWIARYGADHIILGADVRNGMVSINGWKEDSTTDLFTLLDKYEGMGVKNVLCTEISKDGTLQGPATELYKTIMQRHPAMNLIASGGVASDSDIMDLDKAGIPAVVFGKAYYEGRIDIARLLHHNATIDSQN